MTTKVNIAVDAMGGENAPKMTIEGINSFIKQNKKKNDFFFNIYGDENKIMSHINKFNIAKKYYKIFNTFDVISDEETPLTAIKNPSK